MEVASSSLSGKPKHNTTITISDIPDGLLIEILRRLPWKSAKQCMLVSKHWYALMSTPYFTQRFLELNYSSSLLLYYEDDDEIRRLSVTSQNSIIRSEAFSFSYLPCEPQAVAEPVAFCQDLVLCCAVLDTKCVYYLCNPLSKTWIQLPASPTPHDKRSHHGFICQSNGSTFRYVVIRIPWVYYSGLTNDLKVQICSSDSGVWSEKIFSCRCQIRGFPILNDSGIQCRGMLFWKSYSSLVIGIDPFSEGAAACKLIYLPPEPNNDYRILAVCKGTLRLVSIENNLYTRDVFSIRIWDLMDNENPESIEWHLEFNISFSGFLQSTNTTWFRDCDWITPLACEPKNGDIVYILMGLSTIVSCNLVKKTLDVIYECDMFPDIYSMESGFNGAFIYELPWLPTSIRFLPQQNRSDDN